MPVALTRRTALAALAASVALLFVLPDDGAILVPLLLVNAGLLVLALLDALLAPGAAHLVIERNVPPVIALGTTAPIEWHVQNRSRRPLRFWLADELAPSLRPSTRTIGGRLAHRASMRAIADLRPARRGRFVIDEVALRVAGPIGIGARQRTVEVPGEIRVYPPFRSRHEAELRMTRARILEVGLRSAQGRGGGTDFDQMREYTVDDEFRRIDWASTARAGRAMVRSYRAERNQTVLMLLDNGRVMAGRVDDVPRVEHAMDAVMMLTAVATRLGDNCGFVAFDSQVRAVVPPTHRRDQLGAVTEAMYDLEPSLVDSDYRGAFSETLARFRRRALLVILTDLVEQAVGESLLPALPLITRSHVVIVAAVRDPAVEQWAAQVPDDPAEAYRKAAGASAIEERARTAARLRGLGAMVIDAPPGALAPQLADAYLRVKATGRL